MYFQKDSAREFNINKKKGVKPSNLSFTESDKNRLIEMAWQDRVSFDTIKELYGFTENEVKNMMRELLKEVVLRCGEKEFKEELQNIN